MIRKVMVAILFSLLLATVCFAEEVNTSGNMGVEDIKLINEVLSRAGHNELTAIDGKYDIRGVRGELAIITYTVKCKVKDDGVAIAKIRVTLENPNPDPVKNSKIIDIQKTK